MEVGERQRGRRRHQSDVSVTMYKGRFRTVNERSEDADRLSRRKTIRDHLVAAVWNLLSFFCGLLVALLYGFTGLLLNQPLPFCLYTTMVIAGLASFSMGLFESARVSITLMLPSFCSGRGKSFVFLTYVTTLLSGPIANTLGNTERAASSMVCGFQLAANQTQQLLQLSSMPLVSALDKIKALSRSAFAVANRIQNLIQSMLDSVLHVVRILRNVLRFLVDIGDFCNDVLGTPYRKCRKLFNDARTDCTNRLGDFSFLCAIVDAFLPLCNIARVGEIFCVIPSYIAAHLRTHLAEPVVAAFLKFKREFEFNLTASAKIDLQINSSQTLQEISEKIMREITSELQAIQMLFDPLKYLNLLLLFITFIRAAQYRSKYLSKIDFDNIYINSAFIKFNKQQSMRGKVSVLPITRQEATIYISPLNPRLSNRERRRLYKGLVSFLRYLLVGILLVAVDFLLFWVMDQVHQQVTGDIVLRAPVKVTVEVNGSGYASDIYRDLVASFDVLQRGNITVVSKACIQKPSEPDQQTLIILGILLGVALFVTLIGGFAQRISRVICAAFYPDRELERMQFLRQQILKNRMAMETALMRSILRNLSSQGRSFHLQALLRWVPGMARLYRLASAMTSRSCRVCQETIHLGDSNTVTCNTQKCSGMYCQPCFESLGYTCVVCRRSVTFQEDSEEEIDSSDDEHLSDETQSLIPERHEDGRRSNEELREVDMTYQDRSDSESESDVSEFEDDAPSKVIVHAPEPLTDPQDIARHSRSLWDSPGPSKMTQDSPGPSEMTRDSPGPSKMTRDAPGPSEMTRDAPGPSEMTQDSPGPSKMTQDAPGPSKMTRDAPGPSKMTQDAPGSSKSIQIRLKPRNIQDHPRPFQKMHDLSNLSKTPKDSQEPYEGIKKSQGPSGALQYSQEPFKSPQDHHQLSRTSQDSTSPTKTFLQDTPEPSKALLDSPGSSKTFQGRLRPVRNFRSLKGITRTHKDSEGPSATLQDLPEPSKILQDTSENSETLQDHPRPFRDIADLPGPPRTHQDSQGPFGSRPFRDIAGHPQPFRHMQDPPGHPKTQQDSWGPLGSLQDHPWSFRYIANRPQPVRNMQDPSGHTWTLMDLPNPSMTPPEASQSIEDPPQPFMIPRDPPPK